MVKCLTQEHNMLVKAGFEPTTFGLRVNSFIHCATHAHMHLLIMSHICGQHDKENRPVREKTFNLLEAPPLSCQDNCPL